MRPVFIAGPHGAGKTTLINRLVESSERFIQDDFQIDFTNEMTSMPTMTIFEKCLIRLYHRFYAAERALKKCENTDDEKILIMDRSIYDSLVYIEVEYRLGELTRSQYEKLKEIICNSLKMIDPYTVILNPSVEEVVCRLEKRRQTGIRKKRDELCKREDNVGYVKMMSSEFEKLYTVSNIIHIVNNEEQDINKIKKWIDEKVIEKKDVLENM